MGFPQEVDLSDLTPNLHCRTQYILKYKSEIKETLNLVSACGVALQNYYALIFTTFGLQNLSTWETSRGNYFLSELNVELSLIRFNLYCPLGYRFLQISNGHKGMNVCGLLVSLRYLWTAFKAVEAIKRWDSLCVLNLTVILLPHSPSFCLGGIYTFIWKTHQCHTFDKER